LEHTNGRFPTWLAPMQIRVLSFTDRNEKYGKKIVEQLGKGIKNLRLDADFRSVPVATKVREAEMMRIPYILVIGDKEEKSGELAVRTKGDSKIKNIKIDKFIQDLKKEIEERK